MKYVTRIFTSNILKNRRKINRLIEYYVIFILKNIDSNTYRILEILRDIDRCFYVMGS